MEDETGHVNIVGLREVKVESVVHLLDIVGNASNIRATGSTISQQSSRSHAILQVILREPIPNVWPIVGRLCLVLAGSERASVGYQRRADEAGGRRDQQVAPLLEECIRSLDSGKDHVPFRGSKLTQVLKESFVGNSKTVMIATVSPGSSAAEDAWTLGTRSVREFSSKRSPVKGGGGVGRSSRQVQCRHLGPLHTLNRRHREFAASDGFVFVVHQQPRHRLHLHELIQVGGERGVRPLAPSPSRPSSARKSGSPQSSSRTAAARKGNDRPLGRVDHT